MKLTTRIPARLSAPGMLLLVGFVVLCLLSWRSAGPARADAPTNIDWPFYGNDPANTRFQNVDQINPSNVAKVRPAWVFHANNHDNMASLEVSPIVVNGTMYITDGDDDVFAVNAATGQQIWAYHPQDMPPFSQLALCCFRNNRGVAVRDGKVFLGRLDATLVALDAATGVQLWRTVVDDFGKSYSITMAPQYINGKVIVGVAGGEYLIRGHIDAYDANTGKRIWRFFTTDPESFAGDSWQTGGGPVWQTPAFDSHLGMLYVSTGNVGPDINGQDREGMNLYTACIVALDIQTGKLRWYFQEVHHDLWDYDSTPPAVLFTLNGTPAIAHAGKTGFLFILDRRTGAPLFPVTEKPVPTTPAWQHPWPTQPESSVESLTPHSVGSVPAGFTAAPMWTVPQMTPLVMQPASEGGLEWPPMAYSPRTKFVYHGARYIPQVFRTAPGNVGGTLPGWGSTTNDVRGIGEYGLYGAVDTTTGKIAWKITVGNPAGSGMLVAGDLVFFGEPVGLFYAVNAGSGQILWTFDATTIKGAGGANAAPIAYVVNGREFIANAFGGNQNEDPTIVGDSVVAFALPDNK
jgi:quinohemoprotein ethanol dehydrogenase